MNRKLISAVLASGAALFASSAMAADLPSSAPAPAPYIVPPPPVFTWTGFYVGVNAGVAFNGTLNPTFTNAAEPTLSPSVGSTAGFTGGGEIGYNWQVSQLVFGLEGDLDYLNRHNISGTFAAPGGSPGTAYTLSGGNRNQLFGTIRGRVGWAVDRALFYATGGLAFGGNAAPNTLTFSTGGVTNTTYTSTNNTNSNIGEVVGAGIEYAFTPNWTGKIEYLHTFFNNRTVTYSNGANTFATRGYNFDSNIVRVGLNYKF